MQDSKSTAFDDIYPHLRSLNSSREYQDAWSRFWSQYEPRIRVWARQHRLEANVIDEVVGRVMAKLVQVMPTFEYDATNGFSPWLRRVVHNIIIDLWSSAAKRPGDVGRGGSSAAERMEHLPDEQDASDSLGIVIRTAMQEFLERVRQDAEANVRASVKPTTWQAYQLVEKSQLSGKAAAEQTGLSVAGAFMARGRVKDMIEAEIVRLGKARQDEIGT